MDPFSGANKKRLQGASVVLQRFNAYCKAKASLKCIVREINCHKVLSQVKPRTKK